MSSFPASVFTLQLMLSRLLIKECFFFLFSDNAQRAQYEEWLQETQQLLQMQQKFLEEKIGAHRKSKKALSAKQRTAKKAGREFPEEDAEQLKHVTEQQGVVQKQLEQVTIPHLLPALTCSLCHSVTVASSPKLMKRTNNRSQQKV